jgi:hypothetical protein
MCESIAVSLALLLFARCDSTHGYEREDRLFREACCFDRFVPRVKCLDADDLVIPQRIDAESCLTQGYAASPSPATAMASVR